MKKGQAEFIALLAIVIVAAVAILYAFSGPGLPLITDPREQAVRNSIENLIRSGADETMRILSAQGGYPEPQEGVQFLEKPVPYWQRGGTVTIPDARAAFTQQLEEFLNQNKDSFVAGLDGEVTAGDAAVQAAFSDSKITLTVNLPATLDGRPVHPRYQVEVLTKFGEILDFSRQFTQDQLSKRYLEYFTLASIVASPIEQDQFVTPMFIHLTRCGEFVFRSWPDIKPKMEERIETTLAHTYLPGKSPIGVGDITPYPKYVLPRVGGKAHEDLDVSFHLPDDFALSPSSFQFTPNPIIASAEPVGFTGICVSRPIYVNYFLNFPVIVRVRDPLTQHVFQFADQILIKDNAPGPLSSGAYEQDIQAQLCADQQCEIGLTVRTGSGQPVPQAEVSFMGCGLGKTSSQGRLQGQAPCGAGPLQVYKSGYGLYLSPYSHDQIGSIAVTLHRTVSPAVYFFEAVVSKNAQAQTYRVESLGPVQDKRVMLIFRSEDGTQIFRRDFGGFTGKLDGLPSGTYLVTATLMSSDFRNTYGSVTLTATIPETATEVHFAVPNSLDYRQLEDQALAAATAGNDDLLASLRNQLGYQAVVLGRLLDACGVGPVAGEEPELPQPCTKTFSEVGG